MHKIQPFCIKESSTAALEAFLSKSNDQLAELVSAVRTGLTPRAAKIFRSLIVIDVHARNIVEKLITEQVHSTDDFSWTSQMR